MVKIQLDQENEIIRMVKETKDNVEQILIVSVFALLALIFNVIELIREESIQVYILLWLILSLLVLIYFILPIAILKFDFKRDYWCSKSLVFFIPYKFEKGKISDISEIKVIEDIKEEIPKSKFSIKKTLFRSSFELWEFPDKNGEHKKIAFFSRYTYSFESHEKEMNRLTKAEQKLKKIFKKLEIPIDVNFLHIEEKE
ncbi:MAG: hypothetical protein ACTSWL_04705 [Promethearchaeota archaeon]